MIDKFTGDLRFLSTFSPCTVAFEGVLYKTVEHAYQASKTLDKKTRQLIAMQSDPGKARRLGETQVPHSGWDALKVMEGLLSQKIENPFIKPLFEAIKGQSIVFGNTWHDNVLGACSCSKCAHVTKENKLGLLIERLVRS